MKEPGHDEAVDVMVRRRLKRDHAGPGRMADEDDLLEPSRAHRPHDLVDHQRLCLLGELRRQWVTAAARAEEIDVEHGHTLSLVLHERVRARMLRPVPIEVVIGGAVRRDQEDVSASWAIPTKSTRDPEGVAARAVTVHGEIRRSACGVPVKRAGLCARNGEEQRASKAREQADRNQGSRP